MGTNTGTIMTLANSIIGVSVLAMPFCFKQCGIALSILMLIASSLLSRLACHFLLKSAVMARRRTFEFLAFHTFGSTGKFAVELFIIGFLMGTCIAFFVVMGDVGPAIVAKILGVANTMALRQSVLIGLAAFVVLPLGMLRNVDSLSSVSMATIGFYICLVLKVVVESLPHLTAGDWYKQVNFWRPAGILQCIPIFSMALFCQTQLFEIYESMHNASLDRMNFVIRAACNICTGVYICVGFFGYIAFCTQSFTGNVLMSFTPSVVSEMIKLGFVMSVAVSFPLAIFPCRASLYSLLFRRVSMPHHEGAGSHIPEARFKCLTVFIISVALVIGLLIPNIELVLGLVGSTIGVIICVMFPAAAFICMSTKSSGDRLLAQVLLFVGALILVLGTYATLNSATETKPPTEILINEPAPGVVEKTPPFHEKIDSSLVDIPPKLEQKPETDVKPIVQDKEKPAVAAVDVNIQRPQTKDSKVDMSKGDKRQEPPVPVEPPANLQQPTIMPVIKEEKVASKGVEKGEGSKEGKDNMEEKKMVNPETERKEVKSGVGEQVDQEAIKKEDEELAEAEKRQDEAGNSKNEEILRKLEKHEAQQIKILEEQKQILQALQEHQERELFKEQQESAAKNLSQNRNTEIKDQPKVELIIPAKEETKVAKENIMNSVEKQSPPPQKRKQDLLQQIANGELKKPIVHVPSKEIDTAKAYQPSEKEVKIDPSNKNSLGYNNEIPVAEIKDSLHIAAPNVEAKPQEPVAPVQPLLLERLKSPLPLALHNKTKPLIPLLGLEKKIPQEPQNEINAMRREILQEPVISTQAFNIQLDVRNSSLSLKGNLNPSVKDEVYDREKRDIEDSEKRNIPANSADTHNPAQQNINNEVTLSPNQENCQVTERSDETEHNGEMYKQKNEIPNEDDTSNAPAMLKTVDQMEGSETFVPSQSPEFIEPAQNIHSPQLIINTSKAEENTLPSNSPPLISNNRSISLDSIPRDVNIENMMIKSAAHLSDPQVKSKEDNEVTILRQGVSTDAKPMKRDLKSITLSEDKPPSSRKHQLN